MQHPTGRIRIHSGDITQLDTDAIVNAANRRLAPGGGVCGAIHRAAGPELARACEEAAPCPTGDSRLTPGFRLPARYVIHAVGPVWNGGSADEDALLASAYRSALDLARRNMLRSVAFPAISTGVYGFPMERATAIAVRTVCDWLAGEPEFDEVTFVVFDGDAEEAYRAARSAP